MDTTIDNNRTLTFNGIPLIPKNWRQRWALYRVYRWLNRYEQSISQLCCKSGSDLLIDWKFFDSLYLDGRRDEEYNLAVAILVLAGRLSRRSRGNWGCVLEDDILVNPVDAETIEEVYFSRESDAKDYVRQAYPDKPYSLVRYH